MEYNSLNLCRFSKEDSDNIKEVFFFEYGATCEPLNASMKHSAQSALGKLITA